jgi:hypothetical protein
VPLDVETGLSVPVGIGFDYDAVNDVFVAPEVSEVVE